MEMRPAGKSSGAGPFEVPVVDPSSAEWEKYYADASRRRREARRSGRYRPNHLGDLRRQRRLRERLMVLGSVLLLGALTALFHSILTR
jgi:hypothetical protein